jgi:hypothetical protein
MELNYKINDTTPEAQQERLEAFTELYIDNGGNHREAYIGVGFSEKTAKNNARKYLEKNYDYVMKEFLKSTQRKSVKASNIVEGIMESSAVRPSERLKAAEMFMKINGMFKEHVLIEEKVEDLSPEERKQEIKDLMETLGFKDDKQQS